MRNGPLGPEDIAKVGEVLSPGEFELWRSMQPRDCRHSLVVLERFRAIRPAATRAEEAAALLHDVGKVASGLGWMARVVATLVGPRGGRFALYHDHERIGAAMLEPISDRRTVELVAGSVDDEARRDLCRADDI